MIWQLAIAGYLPSLKRGKHMVSLFWQLANRTAETEFISNLFHLLLAGLTLLVVLHQFRSRDTTSAGSSGRLLTAGFVLLSLHFCLLSLYFGTIFFLHRELGWAGPEPFSRGLLACAVLLISGGYVAERRTTGAAVAWPLRGCGAVAAIAVAGYLLRTTTLFPQTEFLPSVATLCNDLLAGLAVAVALRTVLRNRGGAGPATALALAFSGVTLILQGILAFLPHYRGVLIWNVEEHLLSAALIAFAWAAGERSHNLLDRIFVRLNLMFIILAGLIMFVTTGMEKYQYLRLAEERSMELAEFLRGHIVYYNTKGEHLNDIFGRPEVLRRVIVEFGRLPELRQINVFQGGDRASFSYTANWEVRQEIVPASLAAAGAPLNSFEMIRLPIGSDQSSRIELVGTMEYIDRYIGKYIILIYSLFTFVVMLATAVIGLIIADTDRRLKLQYAELQETHQQLAQAAKLASLGELAGGMAHEINSPITSILALATHMAEGKSAATLAPSQRQNLGIIAQQAQRVSSVVRNLLTFSRQSHLELSQVDIGELLEMALTLVQYRFLDGKIRPCRRIDADLPPILGDARRLTEVFVNLFNNALDSMPQGGTLEIRAFRNGEPEGGVRVEVSDTGCGIPPENLQRIFDPFFTTKEPGRGTGLGLSVSHGIVKDHGGQISAGSTPGAGTTVVVTLPKEISRV